MSALIEQPVSRRQVLCGIGGLVAGGLLSGALSGCGASTGGGGKGAVTGWIYRPEYKAAIEKILAAFHDDNPTLHVDMSYKPAGQYDTVLKTALVGGSAPDVIATGSASEIWGDLGVGGNYLHPLDGKIPLDVLTPAAQEAIQYKSHVWAAPAQMFRIGIYYQKSVFADHGLQPPKSWADFSDLCERLGSAGVTPISMAAQDMILPFFFYHLAANSVLGAQGVQALRNGSRKLTDPDVVEAAQYTLDMSKYFNKGFQAVAYAEGKALFAQGRAAMTVGGSSDYAGYVEINPKIDVGFFGFPSPSGDRQVALDGLSMSFTVNRRSKHLADAVTFATWLTSERAQRMVLEELGLPSRTGILPTGTDTRSTVLKAILQVPDSPSWLDYPEIGEVYSTLTQKGSGLFTGKLSPAQFAALAQGAVVPSTKR
jgi:raffinose/stachyose/melibiose transport system substrate-binding protein